LFEPGKTHCLVTRKKRQMGRKRLVSWRQLINVVKNMRRLDGKGDNYQEVFIARSYISISANLVTAKACPRTKSSLAKIAATAIALFLAPVEDLSAPLPIPYRTIGFLVFLSLSRRFRFPL
jgi:hypothetical protein